MSHYRVLSVDGDNYKYLIGQWKTKIINIGVFDNDKITGAVHDAKPVVLPQHIEAAIRQHLEDPTEVYEWDVRPEARVEQVNTIFDDRGFFKIIGATMTIASIDVEALNTVTITDTDGDKYVLSAEPNGPLGIPVISLNVEWQDYRGRS